MRVRQSPQDADSPQPNPDALVAVALSQTRFTHEAALAQGDREVFRAATIATDQAAEMWEAEAGLPVGATVTSATRAVVAMALVARAATIQGAA